MRVEALDLAALRERRSHSSRVPHPAWREDGKDEMATDPSEVKRCLFHSFRTPHHSVANTTPQFTPPVGASLVLAAVQPLLVLASSLLLNNPLL